MTINNNLLNLPKWSWKSLLAIFACYTVYLLMLLIQTYLNYSWRGAAPPSWWPEIGATTVWSYTWALLTPALITFSGRFPISRKHLVRNIFYHLLFGTLLVVIHRTVLLSFLGLIGEEVFRGETFMANVLFVLHHITDGLFTYAFILAIHQAALYSHESQERAFRLQEAQLEVLKTQLQPHFLFNTLNAINALIYVSPPTATKTVSQLSDLLRITLHSNNTQEVTLKVELDFLRKYIQLQQTLLQERLEIEWSIDPETLDAFVPNMLLQPLVENSIRHGIAPKEDGGRIEIFSRYINNKLLLEVKDNGLGTETAPQPDTGIGLTNSKERLKHLYGENQTFEIVTPAAGGWRVIMTIPFREQIQEEVYQ